MDGALECKKIISIGGEYKKVERRTNNVYNSTPRPPNK